MLEKHKQDFNFLYRKLFDVELIKNVVAEYKPEWFIDTTRQDYEAHKDTNSIIVYDYPNDWEIGYKYESELKFEDNKLLLLVNPIIQDLETLYGGRVGKALFVRLPASKKVAEHKDGGTYLTIVRRNHIPIITNPDVIFTIGNESKNLQIGECWEINNTRSHAVENNGFTDRVHFIVDIIPNKFVIE